MDFITQLLASLYDKFKAKSPKAAATIQLILGTIIVFVQNGESLSLFTLPQWLVSTVTFIATFLLAVTGSRTFNYLKKTAVMIGIILLSLPALTYANTPTMQPNGNLNSEINAAVAKLKKCGDLFAQNRQRVSALGGAYAASAADAAAPRSQKVHKRYATAKVSSRIRAPKGSGTVVATYSPGNLGGAMQVMKFSKAKSKVYVGGKLAKGAARGAFGKGRFDAYYLAMVEQGTKHSAGKHFFMRSWEQSQSRVIKIMTAEFQRLGRQFEQQNQV